MSTEKHHGRLRSALALDSRTYAAIADDPAALRGALLTVVGATLLAGLGGLLWTGRLAQDIALPNPSWWAWGGRTDERFIEQTDVSRLIARSVILGGGLQVGLWLAWAAITQLYLWSFGLATPFGRLLRVMGYAFAPVGLQVFLFPGGLELAAAVLAFGYCFAAMVTGVEAATGAPRGQVLLSTLAGFAFFALTLSLLGSGTRDLAPGIFSLDPLHISVGMRPRP